jgi:hypothetical protein
MRVHFSAFSRSTNSYELTKVSFQNLANELRASDIAEGFSATASVAGFFGALGERELECKRVGPLHHRFLRIVFLWSVRG